MIFIHILSYYVLMMFSCSFSSCIYVCLPYQLLKRGANVNDRDGLTDMTLLHYASKSGAAGVGDADSAMRIVSMLIDAGADVNIRCRWTNMSALHYASYFDVVPVLKVLLKATRALGGSHVIYHSKTVCLTF